jgi:hypothetical protein
MTAYSQASWQAAVQTAVTQEMSGVPGFDGTKLQIVTSTATTNYNLMQVTVSAQYQFVPLVNWPGIPGNVTMQRSLCMRQFR